MSVALEVEALYVPFGSAPGLEDVSFTVAAGERLALVGASGAGKTSLLRALAGVAAVASGRVLVEGRDVTSLPVERRGTVLLSQVPLLFPHLSVFENVAFPLRVRRIGRDEVRRRVDEALAAVRMEGFEDRRPGTLSGGQARRVALARAVVARPPVLLLDEPLSALDPALREEVRRSMLAVHESYRPALVLVTHDLEEAGRVADRVGVLVAKRVAQLAAPEVLFRRPASLAVARLLGFPNELRGRVDAGGSLEVGGCRIGRAPAGAPAGSVVAIFAPGAVRLVPAGGGGLPARILDVRHRPGGATARVRARVDCSGGERDGGGTAELEIAVDPLTPPAEGADVELSLDPLRLHVFPEEG